MKAGARPRGSREGFLQQSSHCKSHPVRWLSRTQLVSSRLHCVPSPSQLSPRFTRQGSVHEATLAQNIQLQKPANCNSDTESLLKPTAPDPQNTQCINQSALQSHNRIKYEEGLVELKPDPLDHEYWLNHGAYRQLKELEYQLAVDVQKLDSDKTAVNSIGSCKELGDHLKDEPDVSSKLVQAFLNDTLKSLSIQLNEIHDEMARFDSPSFSHRKFLRYFGLRQSPAVEQNSHCYGPATRSLLATKIEKYVTQLQERLPLHPNPPSDPPPPSITKSDIVSAIGDSYKKMEKKGGSAIWEQLRREIGTRFLQDERGSKTDTVALVIRFDDVSDIIPKELWDDRFKGANTQGKEQEQTREECAETNLKLLFSRAALNKYSKYGNLVKVLACLAGNHRKFLGKKKYQSIRCRVIAESPLDHVWSFDDKSEDEYFSVILETRKVREHTTIQTTTKMQNRNVVSEFDPEEAVSRLKASLSCELSESIRSRLELLLDELKSFAKLVQVSKNHSTEEASTTCNMCPAISVLAVSGAFLATDDTIYDVTVEDILSLAPGKSLTPSAFQKAMKAIISLSRLENVAVVPFALFRKCTSKPTFPDLEEVATYFRTWLSPNQHDVSQLWWYIYLTIPGF